MVRAALAVAAAAAIILSAPFVQQALTAVSATFPSIGVAATAVPLALAVLVAAARIRSRRRLRFSALALAVALGVAYILINSLSFAEAFHLVEYGLLACLLYAAIPSDDGAALVLPLIGGIATGIIDEWFQWFIPIRAGEVRDIALDAMASLCGVLFAISVSPPRGFTLRFARGSAVRVSLCAAATVVLLGFFLLTVHVGYEVRDPAIGTFVSRYTAPQLTAMAHDRAARWRATPPVGLPRLWREDQYLAEGLWHVQRRNEAWKEGNLADAWRENLILETFFASVLDAPTYASVSPQRWPADQRADVASRAGVNHRPSAHADYRYPLFVF